MSLPSLMILFAIWLMASGASGQEKTLQQATWPQWRGPTHDGSMAGEDLVDKFPAAGPPILWIRDLGQGYSGMAVDGERVFTMTQTLYEQQLVCLDAGTGKTVWATRVGWPYDGGGLYPGPRSTPAVVAGQVFYVTPQGVVGCARVSDGEIVWQVDFQERFKGLGTEFGYSCSPLVVDDLVILPVGGASAGVVALNVADGSLKWKAGTKPASYATPVPIEWRGEPLVITLMQNSLCCIHRVTGEQWWDVSMSQGYDEHAAAPLYREPQLLISGPFKSGATMYELVADETKPGRCKPELKWDSQQLSNDVASSLLVGDTIYGFDLREAQSRLHRPSRGVFRALDWATGEVRWSSNEPGHAQLIAADGKLIGFNDRGEVLLFRASPDQYEELGRVAIFPNEVCWTPPALANGRLYLRTQSRIACVYLGRKELATETRSLVADQIVSQARFDPTILLGAERDYPATKPDAKEFNRWYVFSFGVLVLAANIGLFLNFFLHKRANAPQAESSTYDSLAAQVLFWSLVLLWGMAGSFLWHRWREEYYFSWPLALWGVYQLALGFSWRGGRAKFWSRERLTSYGVGIVFLAVSALYFHLCRWLGLALEWCFLTGFVLSFPIAAACEYVVSRPGRYPWILRLFAYMISFAAYYWSSVWFMGWWLGD